MISHDLYRELMFSNCGVFQDEPLSLHTTFRIGGPAALMVCPTTCEDLKTALQLFAQYDCKPLVIGMGSNILAPDEGLDRVVLCLRGGLAEVRTVGDHCIEAMAGATMVKASLFARDHRLSGLEFAHGIPGTVGGGVYMNAGAFNGEMSQVVDSVTTIDFSGNIRVIPCNSYHFGYRSSVFMDQELIILSAVFSLTPGDPYEITERMRDFRRRRMESQPLDIPSAGSAFKRPKDGYAAELIDRAGLKGFQIGGAAVSEKHAGFIVNRGGATAENVKELIRHIQKEVEDRFSVALEPEIRFW